MLILVAHGSRDPKWRGSVESVTRAVQADVGADKVRLAYMDLTPPTLADIVAEAVDGGVKRIRVLPLFIANEGHVDRDIRPAVDELRVIHRSVEIELLPAVGQHRLFRGLLGKIAVEKSGSGEDTAPN